MSNNTKKLLILAGKIADVSINLIGGMSLNGHHIGKNLGDTDKAVRALRIATEEYNLAIINNSNKCK